MIRLPPKVIAATLLVAVAPLAVVWALRATGVLDSFLACSALGAALSLAACQLAARIWERRTGTEDVLFGDLMIWGWARRCFQQRRLDDAVATLGLRRTQGGSDPLTLKVERRAAMLERLAGDLEAGDPYTHGHSRRVARYSAMIAKRMGVTGAELARIRTAAAVHDVGKLETPTEVLHKPGKLTDEEFEIVTHHAAAGARMVAILEDDALVAIVRHHHERLDGSGYPDQLGAGRIPLGARIIAVADTFDAITSARPYRGAKPHREALAILRAESGTKLDRDAVGAFCSVYRGRRTLGVWIALTDVAERVLTWLAPDAVSATARTVAIAATAAAVGGGAAALPAAATGAHRLAAAPATVAGRPPAGSAAAAGVGLAGGGTGTARSHVRNATGRSASSGRRRGGGPGVTRIHHAGGRGSTNAPPRAGSPVAGATGAGAGAGAAGSGNGTPAGAVTVTSDSPPSATVNASGAGAGAGAAVGSSGIHVTVGGGSTASGGGTGVAVNAGSSGASVGVQAGGGSGPDASAGVTVGGGAGGTSPTPSAGLTVGDSSGSGPSVGAHVNVPGVASVNLHVG